MVFATPVPNVKAETKLKKAAQATACSGVSTRVATMVAMEFAASLKPLIERDRDLALNALNLDAVPVDLRHFFERFDGLVQLRRAIPEHIADFHDRGGNRIDSVRNDAVGDVFQAIHDIVKVGAQRVNVLRIEGGDEGLVEPGENLVEDLIGLLLQLLNAGSHQLQLGIPPADAFGENGCRLRD
jgi:hypothetical protein